MIDLQDLTQEEVTALCKHIGIQGIKEFFKNTSRDFNKIKNIDHRVQKLSDERICTIIYQQRKEKYFIKMMQIFMMQIKKYVSDQSSKITDTTPDIATITVLAEMKDLPPELYFKLFEPERSADEVALIAYAYEQTCKKILANKEVSEQDQKKAEEIEEQLHKTEAALKISENQYQYKIHEIEKQLQNVEDEKKQYQQQIKQLQEDLNQEKAKSPTSDCSIIIEAAKMDFSSLSKYQHTSLCVVGIEMLHRYADLDLSSGLLTEFTTDVTKPRLYDNRDRLYHKWMDRYPRGFIGLFNWNAIQNRNDPSNDYIETFYEENYLPVQIIRIISCNTLRELVDQLKAGISQKMAGKKALFVFPQSDNSYYGVCCTESQFTEQGDLIKLKSDIVSLDAYQVMTDDIIHLHDCRFLKQLQPNRFLCRVPLLDIAEVIKKKLLERANWAAAKSKGIQKKDWQFWRTYFQEMWTDDLYSEIIESCQCSMDDVEIALSNLMEHAEQYLSGDDVSTQILAHIAQNDDHMREHCMELLRGEWEKEHSELTAKLETARNDLKAVTEQYQKIADKAERISGEISQKEQLAADVETKITERIAAAKADAAQFISDMAFCSPIVAATPASNMPVNLLCRGTVLQEDQPESITNAEEFIECLRDQLSEAGVTDAYAEPVAAFLLSAWQHRIPVLLAGPNGKSIADALSAVLSGTTAATLQCVHEYQEGIFEQVGELGTAVLAIENPFHADWLSLLIQNQDYLPYSVYLHPFAEDLPIEPKSILHYMLPLMTELYTKDKPNRDFYACKVEGTIKLPAAERIRSESISLLKQCGLSSLAAMNAKTVLSDMHSVLPDGHTKAEIMLGVVPCLYMTGRLASMMDALSEKLNEQEITAIKALLGEIE